jgi:tetratricopeptide (TPR) repeat protein
MGTVCAVMATWVIRSKTCPSRMRMIQSHGVSIGRIYKVMGKEKLALKNYEQALRINRKVGDRGGEGVTLHNIGTIYLEQEVYNIALAYFLLATKIFEKVQSPSLAITQRYIERLETELGKDEFTVLLASVEPQAQNIVDQALSES